MDEDGFYPDVSIGAKARASDGKMYLHHLAYLGDEPPAVKGLYQQIAEPLDTPPDIAASDAGPVRELPSPRAKQLYLSDTPPSGVVKNMSGAAGGFASFPPAAKGTISNKESVVTDEEFNAMKAENEKMRKEISEYRDILLEKAVKEKEEDKAKLKEAADGKLSEAEMGSLLELADTFAEGKTINLSDGGKSSSLRPIQFLAQLMAKLPQPVAPGVLHLSDPAPAEKKENLALKMMGKM